MSILSPWRKYLTRRSILAVSLVALTVTLAYWVLITAIHKEHDEFRIVSLARQQTAELVTTVYLAELTAYAPNPARREAYREQLNRAIRRMEERHHVFGLDQRSVRVPDPMEEVLRDAYLGGQHINKQMEAFLQDAHDVLKSGGNVAELNDLAKRRTSLVPAHIELHELLRAQAEAAFDQIKLLATGQWVAILAALGIVVVLIVRPTTRRTEHVMDEMWEAKVKARERAAAADAARVAQVSFVRTMSHELRTPLNAILGMAQLLRMQSLTPRQDDYVGDIQQAGEHLLGLINNVLDLARIEAKQVTITKEPATLDELLERATGMLRPLAAQKSLDLRIRRAEELSGLYLADGAHIQQVLVNLIGNAVKFTDEGWVEVRAVAAEPEVAGITEVRFEVEDTGIGVPGNRRGAIFEEFQQADDTMAQNYGGSGLGLAISRALVRLMGGKMGLDSEREKGSLFWFVVPLERVTAVTSG